MWFEAFFAEEKPIQAYGTIFQIDARWRYDWCPNGRKKIENLRKWVQSLCAPLRLFISEIKEKYYHSILPHVP